ncbi:histidine kinase dimerization/phospho-acceptor domain-containing protein [Sphingomonas aquatilis]|uniref:histidine kinase n=1 Tax=Sphingomonas aquatilis TaxID=93063 RepID=A0AAW3TS30_9SPHN|nr:histidine kinase dimerization/phospho-acceptor domain-containing protein [Sphingomonas aquatilis]MBB3876478.1 signal transduction histidine kinase [Sphingomonas aquatilis]
MRFDDSLKTVLSADMDSGFGAQSAWRQLVDLMGRGRIAADEPGLARLRMLRQAVPLAVRSASARALAFATPPAPLVGLFAEDAFAVAAPLLRTVTLDADTWIALLPRLSPQGRALLRHRRDLPAAVERALESFGSVDFVLPDAAVAADVAPVPVASDVGPAEVEPAVAPTPVVDASEPEPVVIAPLPAPVEAEPIVVAPRVVAMPTVAVAPPEPRPIAAGGFQIADVVARIDAFQRQREPLAAPAEAVEQAPATCFRFDTDSAGVIFAVDGVTRGPLIGVSLAVGAPQGVVRIDAGINGAFRQRQRFADVRLDVGGSSDAGGAWRVTGEPQFDAATGRFTGYAAIARRPRSDEEAGRPAQGSGASDSLRQLVHELRTPTNAISGFAELIEAQLLGPVSPVYRDHAATIRRHADGLIAAIEDLDTAARIEGRALELRPRAVAIEPLLERIAADLAPLAALRGTALDIHPMGDHAALADDRAMERLLSRLLATLTSAAVAGERIDIAEAPAPAGQVALCFARPQALGTGGEDALLSIDADAGEEGAPLLGAGFALRLARNLASEMGGALIFGDHLLTLRLPAAVQEGMEQAAN